MDFFISFSDLYDQVMKSDNLILAGIAGGITLLLTILLTIFVMPKRKDGKMNGFFQMLHNFFHFKRIYIVALLKFIYMLATIGLFCFGIAFMFTGVKDAWLISLVSIVAGNIVLRFTYELLLLAILLVQNVIDINTEVSNINRNFGTNMKSAAQMVAAAMPVAVPLAAAAPVVQAEAKNAAAPVVPEKVETPVIPVTKEEPDASEAPVQKENPDIPEVPAQTPVMEEIKLEAPIIDETPDLVVPVTEETLSVEAENTVASESPVASESSIVSESPVVSEEPETVAVEVPEVLPQAPVAETPSSTAMSEEEKTEDATPSEATREAVEESAAAETAVSEAPEFKFCPTCGAKFSINANFCDKCGTKLQ